MISSGEIGEQCALPLCWSDTVGFSSFLTDLSATPRTGKANLACMHMQIWTVTVWVLLNSLLFYRQKSNQVDFEMDCGRLSRISGCVDRNAWPVSLLLSLSCQRRQPAPIQVINSLTSITDLLNQWEWHALIKRETKGEMFEHMDSEMSVSGPSQLPLSRSGRLKDVRGLYIQIKGTSHTSTDTYV